MRVLSVFWIIVSWLVMPAQQMEPGTFQHEMSRAELRMARNVGELVPGLDKRAFVIRTVMLTRVRGKAAQISNPGPELSEETKMMLAATDARARIFGDLEYTLQGDTNRRKIKCAFVVRLKD